MPDLRNWGAGRTQTYTYQTPDGKSIDVQSDHPLAADEVRQVFKAAGVDLKLPNDGVSQPTAIDALTRSTSNMTDGPSSFGQTLASNPIVRDTAHPEGLGGILSLLLPNFMGQSLNLGGEAMAAGAKAHPDMGPLRSRVAGIIDRWKNIQPVSDAERAGTGLGKDISLPAEPSVTSGGRDVWDDVLAEARANRRPAGAPPTLRKGGTAPSVSNTLQSALEEAGAPNPAKGTTPPPPTTTPMGKPSITAEQYAQGERAAAAQPKPPAPKATPAAAPPPRAAAPTTGKADKFAEMGDNPDAADIVDRMSTANGGAPPGNGTGGPNAVEDAIAELRRKYGANRIGKAVNPKAPEAGTGTVLRADGSQAPSAMPDMAQKAVLRDLKAGKSNNPAATARAVEQLLKEYSRNKGPANSDVARELADLLKQHGFDTGIK